MKRKRATVAVGAAAVFLVHCAEGQSSEAQQDEVGTEEDASAGGATSARGPLASQRSGDGGVAGDAATSAARRASACTDKHGTKGDRTLTLTGGRVARLHVPASYGDARTMLVFNIHPLLMDATFQVSNSGMDAVSDTRGFLVVYPQGLGNSWNAGDCCDPSRLGKTDDVGFIREVLAAIDAEYCINPKRVFATGFSNGGFLSHRLACEMSGTFAAIAPVAGVLGVLPESCKPGRAVSVMQVHGTLDPLVPWGGGKPSIPIELGYSFRSVADSTTFWRTKNACPDVAQVASKQGDATCQRWGPCRDGTDVTLCTIDGGGHSWPGSALDLSLLGMGKTSHDLAATKEIVDFFERHPMK